MSGYQINRMLIVIWLCMACAGCNQEVENPETAPETPTHLPSMLKIKHHPKTYVITGLGLSNAQRVAIINDKIVKEGSEIGPDALVKEITLTYARIAVSGSDYLIRPENIQRELEGK